MTHHFSTLGCNDPTKDEIHVDMVELKEIYTEYVDDIKVLHTDGAQFALSYPRFCWLLQVAFKHVKIREYRSVILILSCLYHVDEYYHITLLLICFIEYGYLFDLCETVITAPIHT